LAGDAGPDEEAEHRARAANEPGALRSHYDYRPANIRIVPAFPNIDTAKPRKRTRHGRCTMNDDPRTALRDGRGRVRAPRGAG